MWQGNRRSESLRRNAPHKIPKISSMYRLMAPSTENHRVSLAALTQIVFLIGGIAARRHVLERPRASYRQMQSPLTPDWTAAKNQAIARRSPMSKNPNYLQARSH